MNMHGSPISTLTVCREVFCHYQTQIYSDGNHFKHITFCLHCLHVLHYWGYPACDYLREREREREREYIELGKSGFHLIYIKCASFERERERERGREIGS